MGDLPSAEGEPSCSQCSPSSPSPEQEPPVGTPPPPPVDLLERIRELEESHARIKEEMNKLLEERKEESEAAAAARSHQATALTILGRSQSLSPPERKDVQFPRQWRTLSERFSAKGGHGPSTSSRSDDECGAASVSESPYVNILESMGQAVYMFTTCAEVTYWNRMAEQLYGFSASEAVGRNVVELLIDKSSMETASKIVARLCLGESWVGQFPLKKKSGEIFPAMITNTPLYDKDGKLLGIIGVSSDARPFMKAAAAGVKIRDNVVWKPTHDWHQPWQIPFASTLSNLASKILSHLRGNPLELGSSSGCGADFPVQAKSLFKAGSWMSRTGLSWPWGGAEQEGQASQQPPSWAGNFDNHDRSEPMETSTSLTLPSIDNNVSSSMSSNASMSSTASSSSSSRVGHTTDDFESPEYEITWESLVLYEPIGQGSTGTVYRGAWCGADVAVKLFHEEEYNDAVLEDFKKEVAIMRRLRHPNVLLFLGAVTSPEHLCIITELMPRGSLFRLLHKKPSGLDWKRKLSMALDVARGMNYLHHCTPPILHRDLKSTNLLVDRNLKVKVGDFSLSRLKISNFLTANAKMGTSQWMPPEVLRSEPSNEKSDVYSFGVILWELATEEVPWKDLDPLQVVAVVGFMDRRLTIPEDVDPKFAEIIQDCWKSNWQERPTFEDLSVRLRDILISATRDSQYAAMLN